MSTQDDPARRARLQIDHDRAAGTATPASVLRLAAADRTVEPLLDGNGHILTSGDGTRPLTIPEAEAGDAWSRTVARRSPPPNPDEPNDDLTAIRAELDRLATAQRPPRRTPPAPPTVEEPQHEP